MKDVRSAVVAALEDAGVDDARKKANKVIKSLATNGHVLARWLGDMGVLRFVGYASRHQPRRVRDVPLTKDDTRVYVIDGDEG